MDPREDAPILGGPQGVQGHGQQDAEGQANVVRVADGPLPLPQQRSQDVQDRPDQCRRHGLFPTSLSGLQLQGEERGTEDEGDSPEKQPQTQNDRGKDVQTPK